MAKTSHLTLDILNLEDMRSRVAREDAGAVILFEGTVRNHSDGLTGIIAIEYEAQESMAEKLIATIVAEVRKESCVLDIAVRHRLGRVELGQTAVIVAVSAAHRDEAYQASRKVIDRIKHEAPIWKREILPGGAGQWSRGCRAHFEDSLSRINPDSNVVRT